MHQMRLTNKQIQEILSDMRKQLKNFKTITGELSLNYTLENKNKEAARLIILPVAWEKLIALVDECDKEIAWHGTVTKTNNTYTITDIFVFPQAVTGCTVTSDDTEYSLWLANQPDAVFNSLRFHGHSHVNMGVTPSGVDKTYQEDILRNLKDFYIFAIFNKKGEHWCAIYDVESNTAYDNDDIEIITPNTGNTEWARKEIKTLVKEYRNPIVNTQKTNKKKTKNITKSVMEDLENDYDGYYYGYGLRNYGGYYGQE